MADEELTTEEQEQERRERAQRAREESNNARLARLDAIANQADESRVRDEELTDLDDKAWREPGTEEPVTREEVVAQAADKENELDEARAAGADDVRETNGVTYYRLVVNGKEKWLTLAELRATASKVESGDEYLRTAKEAAKTVVEQAPSPKRDERAGPDKDRARELIANAMMGDQEAIDALAEAISRPSSNPEDVLRVVDERVDGRLTFREAVSQFQREFAEELKIPVIQKYIYDRDEELAREHPQMGYSERLTMAGNEGREQLRSLRASLGVAPGVSKIEEKRTRKAEVRAPQAASGRPAANLTDDEGEETYEQGIAKIAAARGQSRPIIHKR